MIWGNIMDNIKKYLNKRNILLITMLLIVICVSVISITLFSRKPDNDNNINETQQHSVIETPLSLEYATNIVCRYTTYVNGKKLVYSIAKIDNNMYVFRGGELAGKSNYTLTSKDCKTLNLISKNELNTEKILSTTESKKDKYVDGLYSLSLDEAEEYISSLVSSGYIIESILEKDSFIEVILKNGEEYTRCILANDTLMICEIGEENTFDFSYYIDNYIY